MIFKSFFDETVYGTYYWYRLPLWLLVSSGLLLVLCGFWILVISIIFRYLVIAGAM